jgi:uncharacterized membrane protein YgcG
MLADKHYAMPLHVPRLVLLLLLLVLLLSFLLLLPLLLLLPPQVPDMAKLDVDIRQTVTWNFLAQLALTAVSWAIAFFTSHTTMAKVGLAVRGGGGGGGWGGGGWGAGQMGVF